MVFLYVSAKGQAHRVSDLRLPVGQILEGKSRRPVRGAAQLKLCSSLSSMGFRSSR